MKVELFSSFGCRKCVASKDELRELAERLDPNLFWREVNVIEELDYAVELGVLSLPALAIDGELVFTSLPTAETFCDALSQRLKGSA